MELDVKVVVIFGEKKGEVVIGRIYKNIAYIGQNTIIEHSFLLETKIVKKPHKYQLEVYGTYMKKIIKTLNNLKENLKKNGLSRWEHLSSVTR